MINVCTTEKRRFLEDLPQGGLEIPCILSFEGASKEIHKVKKLVTAALSNNPTPSKAARIMMKRNPTKEEQKKTAQRDTTVKLKQT